MIKMAEFVSLLTAAGLGSIATLLVQFYLSNRKDFLKRVIAERREAFIGLLSALHRAGVEKTDSAAKEFAYWQMRCELVASKDVIEAIQDIINTNENRELRLIALEKLKDSMRKDLGIS